MRLFALLPEDTVLGQVRNLENKVGDFILVWQYVQMATRELMFKNDMR